MESNERASFRSVMTLLNQWVKISTYLYGQGFILFFMLCIIMAYRSDNGLVQDIKNRGRLLFGGNVRMLVMIWQRTMANMLKYMNSVTISIHKQPWEVCLSVGTVIIQNVVYEYNIQYIFWTEVDYILLYRCQIRKWVRK